MKDADRSPNGGADESPRPPDRLYRVTQLLGRRYIAFHPRLVFITGRLTAGLMLSQAIYWTRRLALAEPARFGWFWKTREDWRNETGLSRREQDHSRRILRGLGLLQEKRIGMPARLWFRIDLDVLGRRLAPEAYAGWDWRNERAVLQLLGRPFLFYRVLSEVTGSATSAVLLSHLLAQERSRLRAGERRDVWEGYQFDVLRRETGLSRHELYGARQILRQSGVLDERRAGMPPRSERAIRLDRLITLLSAGDGRPAPEHPELRRQTAGRLSENVPASRPENGSPVCGQPAIQFAVNPQTGNPEPYRPDIRNRTDRPPESVPTGRADSGAPVGTFSENHLGLMTTDIGNTPPSSTGNETAPDAMADGRGWSESLVWPRLLCTEERPWAVKLLSAQPDRAQLLLDELAGQAGRKVIESPLGYLRTLVRQAEAGEFVPGAALRVQAERRRTAQAVPVVDGTGAEMRAGQIRAGLQELRRFMARGMDQGRRR